MSSRKPEGRRRTNYCGYPRLAAFGWPNCVVTERVSLAMRLPSPTEPRRPLQARATRCRARSHSDQTCARPSAKEVRLAGLWCPRANKQDESVYPRSWDRHCSRKTRAAVGKPTGSTSVGNAVRFADSTRGKPSASAAARKLLDTTAVANHKKWAHHEKVSAVISAPIAGCHHYRTATATAVVV